MKTTIFLSIALLSASLVFSQGKTTELDNNSGQKTDNKTSPTYNSDFNIDFFIVGGSLGVGPIVSTNIVGSGFVGESTMDFMVQSRHHRYGLGYTNTLMGTPENLAVLIFTLGKDNRNLKKYYFSYEWTLFKRSPINIGAGLKVGTFTVGNFPDETKTPFFASVGPLIELGHPRFFLYVKPEIGYNSYNTKSWKKDVYVCANIGLRWKIKTEEPLATNYAK